MLDDQLDMSPMYALNNVKIFSFPDIHLVVYNVTVS